MVEELGLSGWCVLAARAHVVKWRMSLWALFRIVAVLISSRMPSRIVRTGVKVRKLGTQDGGTLAIGVTFLRDCDVVPGWTRSFVVVFCRCEVVAILTCMIICGGSCSRRGFGSKDSAIRRGFGWDSVSGEYSPKEIARVRSVVFFSMKINTVPVTLVFSGCHWTVSVGGGVDVKYCVRMSPRGDVSMVSSGGLPARS